jgi:hypothetical protein
MLLVGTVTVHKNGGCAEKNISTVLLCSEEVRKDVKSWIRRSCNAEFNRGNARFDL